MIGDGPESPWHVEIYVHVYLITLKFYFKKNKREKTPHTKELQQDNTRKSQIQEKSNQIETPSLARWEVEIYCSLLDCISTALLQLQYFFSFQKSYG